MAVIEADETSPVEQKKFDEAVVFINDKLNTAARSMIDIGQYLLRQFFNNDPRLVQEHYSVKQGLSLRKLSQRPDLDVSYASLSNAVQLAVQEERVFKQLPNPAIITETHKLLLLQVNDDEAKLRYADVIHQQHLSTRALRELLIEDKIIMPRGRPTLQGGHESLPIFAVEDLLKPLAPFATISYDEIPVNKLTPEQAKNALELMVKARDNIAALIERLKAVSA